MKMTYYVILMVVSLLFTACSTPNACGCRAKKAPQSRPPVHDSYESYTKTYTFRIISNPPGAKISVNGKEIGTAPVNYTATAKISPTAYKAEFAYYKPVRLSIVAYPISKGQFTQEKTIEINPDDYDSIPVKVVFDMSVEPNRPRYGISY